MNPEQQALFDLSKTALAAVLAFMLAIGSSLVVYYALNRDRRLRILEREGKKHKFWKDFFEAQHALPMAARYSQPELDAAALKCKADLDRSYDDVMGHAIVANTLSQLVAIVVTVLAFAVLNLIGQDFFEKLFLIASRAPTPLYQLLTSLIIVAAVCNVFYVIFYAPTKNEMKQWILNRQRRKTGVKIVPGSTAAQ